jgi:hypothetical protein
MVPVDPDHAAHYYHAPSTTTPPQPQPQSSPSSAVPTSVAPMMSPNAAATAAMIGGGGGGAPGWDPQQQPPPQHMMGYSPANAYGSPPPSSVAPMPPSSSYHHHAQYPPQTAFTQGAAMTVPATSMPPNYPPLPAAAAPLAVNPYVAAAYGQPTVQGVVVGGGGAPPNMYPNPYGGAAPGSGHQTTPLMAPQAPQSGGGMPAARPLPSGVTADPFMGSGAIITAGSQASYGGHAPHGGNSGAMSTPPGRGSAHSLPQNRGAWGPSPPMTGSTAGQLPQASHGAIHSGIHLTIHSMEKSYITNCCDMI